MSGGVGPTACDITLPKDQEVDFKEQQDQDPLKNHDLSIKGSSTVNTTTTTRQHTELGMLSFNQLNSLAVVIVLSASGMVSMEDFGFVFFSLIYMYFISKVAFPSLQPSTSRDDVAHNQSKLMKLYALVGATVGLFAPIAYILEGVFEGDKEGITAAAPHVFLLASQVFMEGLASSHKFSGPIRAFVPTFYSARRIFTIVDWIRSEVYKGDAENAFAWRLYVGRGLAIANMLFSSFNLFAFLLPFYLPKVLKGYYCGTQTQIHPEEKNR